MRKLLFALLCCCSQLAMSQVIIPPNSTSSFFQTMGGQPITATQVTRFRDGTPFLSNDWMRGTIVTPDGKSFKDEQVKLNLLEGTVHYKDLGGEELVAITKVKEVILIDPSGKRMKFVHSSSIPNNELGDVWLQELNEGTGPVRVFKQIKKDVKEQQAYSSATKEIYVTDTKRYYLLANNYLQKIKKLKDITDVLSNKWNELDRFINVNSLKEKREEDMGKLVDYYNSLTKK